MSGESLELEEMGYVMRAQIEAYQHARGWLNRRLEWTLWTAFAVAA